MTDALHSFYAMRCDVLVARDEGMQRKAEVEFKHFNFPTRIISIEELQSFLEEELEREYNLCYIQKEVIPKYSIGKDRGGDKLAYKNVPSSIFGLFTNCIKIPNAPNTLA